MPNKTEDITIKLHADKGFPEVCNILDIPDDAVNNYKPLPLPEMVGAGRVKPFRAGL